MKPGIATALFTTFFLSLTLTAHAQAKESTDWAAAQLPIPDGVQPTWQLYDSLGDAYLFKGDSIMAVYCYEKAIRLNPVLNDSKKSYEKIKRHYRQQESSFYLKEDY